MYNIITSYVQSIFVVLIQIYWVLYFLGLTDNIFLKLLIICIIPVLMTLTSFFLYYVINTLFNIVVPVKWIENDSETATFLKKNITNEFFNNYICNNTKNDGSVKNNLKRLDSSSESFDNEMNDKRCLSRQRSNSSSNSNFKIPLNLKDIKFNKSYYHSSFDISYDNRQQTELKNLEDIEEKNSDNSSSPGIDINIDIENIDSSSPSSIDKNSNIILTIIIPVYDEPFDTVINKTLNNLLCVCRDFNEKFDKKINILICEDGIQAINNENEIINRKQFYDANNEIFYIARKKENRRGKFKKASNINFCLNIIRKINDEKMNIEILSQKHNFIYKDNTILSNNFSIGRYMLLVDSDSRMNTGIIYNLIYELMSSDKKIAYLQCRTSADLVCDNNHWEKTIAHFTNAIYNISFLYSAANGNPSPLVGHNCVLDWDIITNVLKKNKYKDNYSGKKEDYIEYWDENGVSEDFALSLDLYIKGYFGKYIYFDCGFKEGVTLNVDDEITKFSKYAYGVNEILFNSINEIKNGGIFSDRARRFILTDKIPFYIKLSIISYIGIYYSMAICPIVSLLNFFRYYGYYSEFHKNILDNILMTILIFFILTPISNIITKIRHKLYTNVWKMIGEEIYYDLFLLIFFGGIQYHLLKAMVFHFFEINITWGATSKEYLNNSVISKLVTYYDMYMITLITMIGCIFAIYFDHNFLNYYSIIPIGLNLLFHIFMPLVL
jgi:hypothetical protein